MRGAPANMSSRELENFEVETHSMHCCISNGEQRNERGSPTRPPPLLLSSFDRIKK